MKSEGVNHQRQPVAENLIKVMNPGVQIDWSQRDAKIRL